jgi:hypothetical protein
MNLLKFLKLSVASCIFILTFSFFGGIVKGCLFFVNGATLLQMPVEVIQYPLTIALEGNHHPLGKD